MIYITGNLEDEENFFKAEEHMIDTNTHHNIYGNSKTPVINPITIFRALPELEIKDMINIQLHLLSLCDTLYCIKSWQNDVDARLLHDYARANNYKVVYSKKF